MKRTFYVLALAFSVFFVSCNKEETVIPNAPSNPSLINKSGSAEGLNYAVKGVAISPNAIILNTKNATLMSSENDLEQGIIKLSNMSDEVVTSLAVGKVLYIQSENYSNIRRIVSFTNNGSEYVFETTQGNLGDVFSQGTITAKLDVYEACKTAENKLVKLKSTGGHLLDAHIINIHGEHVYGPFVFTPDTDVKLYLDFEMDFNNIEFPTRIKSVFGLDLAINPTLTFATGFNQTYEKVWEGDLIEFVPQALMEYLKDQIYTISIPVVDGMLDAFLSDITMPDIKFPTRIEANISQETKLGFGVNGVAEVGFEMNIDGLSVNTTPIFKNTIAVAPVVSTKVFGEVTTSMGVELETTVDFIHKNVFNARALITADVVTTTQAGFKAPAAEFTLASKADIVTKLDLYTGGVFDLLTGHNSFANEPKNLWNIGSDINQTIVLSNAKATVTGDAVYKNATFYYPTRMDMNYEYPNIPGKQIPSKLYVSYKVYNDGLITDIELTKVKELPVKVYNNVDNTFSFDLEIPILTSISTSYIKNLVIKDVYGYEYNFGGEKFTVKK